MNEAGNKSLTKWRLWHMIATIFAAFLLFPNFVILVDLLWSPEEPRTEPLLWQLFSYADLPLIVPLLWHLFYLVMLFLGVWNFLFQKLKVKITKALILVYAVDWIWTPWWAFSSEAGGHEVVFLLGLFPVKILGIVLLLAAARAQARLRADWNAP